MWASKHPIAFRFEGGDGPPGLQGDCQLRIHRENVMGVLGLDLPDMSLNYCPLNCHRSRIPIKVGPLQSKQLTATQSKTGTGDHHRSDWLPRQFRQERLPLNKSDAPAFLLS